MVSERDLLERIARLPIDPWTGTAFRHTSVGRSPISGIGSRLQVGRWNPKDVFGAIYLAVPVETCLAELRRAATEQARGLASILPRELHTISVVGQNVINVAGLESQNTAGVNADELRSDVWAPCQTIAEAAHFLGLHRVAAPSATGIGLVVQHLMTGYRLANWSSYNRR